MFEMSLFPLLLVLILAVAGGYIVRLFIEKITLKTVKLKTAQMMKEAEKEIETQQKEALIEGKNIVLQEKKEFEQELREQRNEIKKMEKRLLKKEENYEYKINKRNNELSRKEKNITQHENKIKEQQKEISNYKKAYNSKLEKLARCTSEEAKQIIINNIKNEAEIEAQTLINKIEQETRLNAKEYARKTIITSIQRLAPEISQEASISSISLPNDDMKGRIIGREGRNIRALEVLTGVDIIIDDTPEAIVLSCFDPVRREKARETIIKLIADGRIHPSRIEEVFHKTSDEIDKNIINEGDKTFFELGIKNIPKELKECVGKLKYRYSYGQNILNHSKEVANIASYIAAEIGADKQLAKRGGLLHDIGKCINSNDNDHAKAGADLAKKYGEHDVVVNSIASHHFDVEPKYPEAIIVQTADAISASRPGARRVSFKDYITRLTNLETIAYKFPSVEKAFAIQAGRELRIIVNNNTTSDHEAKIVARDIANKIESEMQYPGQVKVSLIREYRITEYAK